MNRRLDMGRHGFPFDHWRRWRQRLRRTDPGLKLSVPAMDAAPAGLEDRCVRTAGCAVAGSVFREVFAGIERFPALAAYAHGSWGDGTMTPFSDYDDLVIVDYDRVSGALELDLMEKFLHEVDMRFCHLDPLQHHGHWIIDRENLEGVDESYIPLSVLKSAICVQGEEAIRYRVDVGRSLRGFKKNIALTCDGAEQWFRKYHDGRINLYEMKCLVGSYLIMPAYAFQSLGQMITKREALQRAGELFGSGAVSVIAKCTEIRRDWGRALDTPGFERLRSVGRLITNGNLHRRYARLMAGRFPAETFPRLGLREVGEFIREARHHADNR